MIDLLPSELKNLNEKKQIEAQLSEQYASVKWLITLCWHDTNTSQHAQQNLENGVYDESVSRFITRVSTKLYGSNSNKTRLKTAYSPIAFGWTGRHPHVHLAVITDLLGTESSRRYATYEKLRGLFLNQWERTDKLTTIRDNTVKLTEDGYSEWFKPVEGLKPSYFLKGF